MPSRRLPWTLGGLVALALAVAALGRWHDRQIRQLRRAQVEP